MKKIISFLTLFLIYSGAYAQQGRSLDELQHAYQTCLDTGNNGYGCAVGFYQQMDSLLNVVYNGIRVKANPEQKENLKDEQLEWLAKRDLYFKKTFLAVKKNSPGATPTNLAKASKDDKMIMYGANATYVKSRVAELMKRGPADYDDAIYQVNPEGYYLYKNRVVDKKKEIEGYYGNINVKKLADGKVVLNLFICRGAPSYNSGSLNDTLAVKNNIATYLYEGGKSCRITFHFYRQGIKVEEHTAENSGGCGFGYAVYSDGFYNRRNKDIR